MNGDENRSSGSAPYGDAIVKDTEEVLNKALDDTRTLLMNALKHADVKEVAIRRKSGGG